MRTPLATYRKEMITEKANSGVKSQRRRSAQKANGRQAKGNMGTRKRGPGTAMPPIGRKYEAFQSRYTRLMAPQSTASARQRGACFHHQYRPSGTRARNGDSTSRPRWE